MGALPSGASQLAALLSRLLAPASCPGHGLVNTEFHGIGGIIPVEACGIAAGIVDAEAYWPPPVKVALVMP